MEEFVLPDFLQETEEETHQKMIRMAPPNIDTAEGALYWDHTRPTARVKDELVGYELTLTLMMKFPQFAVGPFLDLHGDPVGVYRRPAVPAIGEATFEGALGTFIPVGTVVTTIGDDNEASLLYEVIESGVIDESGLITLQINAVEPGSSGNVPIGSIQGITKSISGLTNIYNTKPTKDGADQEDDDSFRERILDRHRNKPLSGARRDYERWAKEVPGVGDVIVIPLWNGPKTVKVLITDSERQLASAELITAVKNHIDPVDGMGEGVAPIGAVVTVDTLTLVLVNVEMSLVLEENYLLEDILDSIKSNLNLYFADREIIKWSEAVAVIVGTEGVADHSGLLLNGSTENILLNQGERAAIGEVIAA
ncbi:baseplate J/gp47 family protein [Sporosarcina koreensis]|uniref:baseplate J/gp47 family protein n=1 Tax=Sporosarcina koreensis TaxID=334735 RepID=UPI00075D3821|nr:baseplate J/gp47 family protein [Sporosarcina koreensis]